MGKKILRFIYVLCLPFLFSCGKKNSVEGAPHIIQSAIVVSSSKIWQNNSHLVVTFLDGTMESKKEVETITKEWTKYANIDFDFYDFVEDVPKGKRIDVIISFSKVGNDSAVGTDSFSKIKADAFSMSLSILDKKYINIRRKVILHEFGHVLGLQHEHQNINRNFTFDDAKTKEYCLKDIGFDEKMCKLFIINPIENSNNDVYFSSYDPLSIMHYWLHPGETIQKVNFRNNQSLSLIDKIEIAKIYPGRMSAKQIIESHKFNDTNIQKIETYGNCKINKTVFEKIKININNKPELIKINFYSFSSIAPGEFTSDNLWEDKEGFLYLLKNEEYCNFDEIALRDFRENQRKDNFKNKKFGNCVISLPESKIPNESLCNLNFPYQIFEVKNQIKINDFCYPSFKTALKAMKETKYCSFTEAELEKDEKIKKTKFEESRRLGSCFVENSASPRGAKYNQCVHKYNWFISINNRESLDGFCYSTGSDAVEEMAKKSQCQ